MIRLAVRVAATADAEIVLAELLELTPDGVEEVALGDGHVEYAVYGSPGELPEIPDVRAAAGGIPIEVSSSEVADDWQERWKRFHRPVLIESPAPASVPSLYVRPPWESPAPSGETGTTGEAVEVVIDPGRAFGTGSHATTRLCLELMLELEAGASPPRPKTLLDVGTGSGVLAIAAAKLGYEPIVAFDHDRDSLSAAAHNASVNGVDFDLRRSDLRTEGVPPMREDAGPPTVIVANLLRPLLLDLARALPASPPQLLASGLLVGEVDEILDVYADTLGMHERDRRESGEWAAIWLQAPGAQV